MTTIAYDLPVKDLIAGLNATGHVTHTEHRKGKVTLHHNGGFLSHEGVLSVWKTRPASAHFDVDSSGAVAQYVRVAEYAWACGDTLGNQTSISIEMCNQSGGPNWVVGEATWKSAARLAGWLLARVIGERPNSNNLVRHKYWSSTECAGPYIDKVYDQILALAQKTYDAIVHGSELDGKEDGMVEVQKGDDPARMEYWLVSVTSEGAGKKHIKSMDIVEVFEELLGKETRVVKQWALDFISTTGSIG